MKGTKMIAVAFGLASLAACNNSAREQKADNIEANSAAADAMENKADAIRDAGDNIVKDVRINDPNSNLANGM